MMSSVHVRRLLLQTCRTSAPLRLGCPQRRAMSIMSKIPFLGKGSEKEDGFADVVTDRYEEWYEQELPSLERVESVLQPLAEEHLDLTTDEAATAAWRSASFPSLAAKFAFLNAAIEELQRDIPSSQLTYLASVEDVIRYYQTPVEQPRYIELRPQSLPLNVKIVMDSIKKPIDQS